MNLRHNLRLDADGLTPRQKARRDVRRKEI